MTRLDFYSFKVYNGPLLILCAFNCHLNQEIHFADMLFFSSLDYVTTCF